MGKQGEGRKGRRREGEWTAGRGSCYWMAGKPDQGSDSRTEAQKEGPFQSNVTTKTGTLGWWLRISLHPTYVGHRGMGKAEEEYMMSCCKPRGRQHLPYTVGGPHGWRQRLLTKRWMSFQLQCPLSPGCQAPQLTRALTSAPFRTQQEKPAFA